MTTISVEGRKGKALVWTTPLLGDHADHSFWLRPQGKEVIDQMRTDDNHCRLVVPRLPAFQCFMHKSFSFSAQCWKRGHGYSYEAVTREGGRGMSERVEREWRGGGEGSPHCYRLEASQYSATTCKRMM